MKEINEIIKITLYFCGGVALVLYAIFLSMFPLFFQDGLSDFNGWAWASWPLVLGLTAGIAKVYGPVLHRKYQKDFGLDYPK